MTIRKPSTVSHGSNASHVSKTKSAPSAAAAAPEVAAVDTTPVEKTVIYVGPPPADAHIPVPPQGALTANPVDYRALLPKNLELSAMPDVLAELARFTEYATVFGKTAPPLAFVEQTFDAATKWSSMRVAVEAWDVYARSQEGAAWFDVRDIIASLKPAFQLASKSDNTLARQFPALVRLFNAPKEVAARGLVTRVANNKQRANGEAPTHGGVGKRATKKAAKAALASAQAAASTTAGGGAAAATNPTVTPGSNVGSTTAAHAAVATAAPAGATTGAAS